MILAAITTHKRPPAMVERALKSVVNQTYTDWNLVVVDDSPADYRLRDDVRKMVENWAKKDSRIFYIAHDINKGVSAARNTALNLAENTQGGGGYDFIAYLDDDDEWLPEKLEKQLAKFRECGEDTALVYCKSLSISIFGNIVSEGVREGHNGNIYKEMLHRNCIGSPSFPMIRTKCLRAIGCFDEDLFSVEDYEMFLRITKRYNVAFVNELLVISHYGHAGRMSNNLFDGTKGLEYVINKHKEDFLKDKFAYWKRLRTLITNLSASQDYKKAFKIWCETVVLQPQRFISNFKTLFRGFIVIPFKNFLRGKNPGLLYRLLKIKHKMEGEIYVIPTREQALELVKQHNKEESHIHHAIAVENTMRHFAEIFNEDPELWGVVGLLHDIDWEETTQTPEKHCHVAPEILRAAQVDESIIRAVQSHGWGICTDVEPISIMERTLFTIDELTGLIITAGLVRPSKSLADLELKSVKKKWKDKAFARGVNREIIKQGAEKMNMPLDDVINETIKALRPVEKLIGM